MELLKKIVSLVVLIGILYNAQGVFIEHHDCVDCEASSFYESDCASCGSTCDMSDHKHHNEEQNKEEHCYLYDFSDENQGASCACFADFIQIPVYYSEINDKADNSQVQELFWISFVLGYSFNNKETVSVSYYAPPDTYYQTTSKQLLFCTFLC